MNTLERKPDARDGHVRFDERGVETGCMIGYSGTGNRKGRTPLGPGLKRHRATPRLYKFKEVLFSRQGPDGEARAKAHTRSGL